MINKRYFHLLKTAWLTWRLRKAKTTATREAARHALAAQLANGRGLPMKIGQVLAGVHDDTAYQSLTHSVEPWPLKEMLPVLEYAWSTAIDDVLLYIKESEAAASLGQVHQGQLIDGTKVAIKLQYPDIAQAVESEMTLAGLMPRGGPVKRWDFDLDAYKSTLKKNMLHELDYLHEMKQQQRFKQLMHIDGLEIPEVLEHLCRSNVLTQTWVEGSRLSQTLSWSKIERLQISKTLMQTMFQSVFEAGLVHGDPHPGNMLFQQHEQQTKLTLLDFGCMLEISQPRRLALLQLISSLRGECQVFPIQGFTALGFDPQKLLFIENELPQLMQIIFRPFIEDKPFNLKQWHPGKESEALLGDKRWIFRAAGPADLFLLMRVFQGLVQQLVSLDSQLPWWPILQQSISEQTHQQAIATTYPRDERIDRKQAASTPGSAELLHITVTEDNQEKAHITLPAASALQLSSLIPDSAHKVITQQGINIIGIEQQLTHQGLKPQQLLDIQDQNKHYKLWLE